MRTLFADTGYWIAMSNPHDDLHGKASTVIKQLGICRIVTSQMVLVEFLNYMSSYGQHLRRVAVSVVNELEKDPGVEIIPQTESQFDSAVAHYASRSDKGWSLTDCASFVLMEERHIPEALAHDKNFEQAGFVALLRELSPA